jgi:hypothetical protein
MVWATDDLQSEFANLKQLTSMVKALVFSPDGRHLLAAAAEMQTCVWRTEDLRLVAAWFGPVNQIAFADNEHVVVGEATGNKRKLRIPNV